VYGVESRTDSLSGQQRATPLGTFGQELVDLCSGCSSTRHSGDFERARKNLEQILNFTTISNKSAGAPNDLFTCFIPILMSTCDREPHLTATLTAKPMGNQRSRYKSVDNMRLSNSRIAASTLLLATFRIGSESTMLSFSNEANEVLLLRTYIVTLHLIAKVIAKRIDIDYLRSTGMDKSQLSIDFRSHIAPP
jgi:hypothetical protein